MSAHTPGPWSADICHEGWGEHVVYVGKGNADAICRLSVRESFFAPDDDEAIANARLIASAPDLLAALQTLMDEEVPESLERWTNACDAARAAIAKATGVAA